MFGRPALAKRRPNGRAVPTRPAPEETDNLEKRCHVVFIGSECYPFVKTGGLGDVIFALPRALTPLNCEVRVMLPRYACIPEEYQRRMAFRGDFMMNLCADGWEFYVGIYELEQDGVVYTFLENDDFFSWGRPYTDLGKDVAKYCYFGKAALAALNYIGCTPDLLHCHDWQASLVPVYLRTLFADTPVARAKCLLTIHNLRFQGVHNIPTVQYWSGLPSYLFHYTLLKEGWDDANMFKGGLAFADSITTVSPSYAEEIQTPEYGEHLDAHLRYHAGKLCGIVNGIDTALWDSRTDPLLAFRYDETDAPEKKALNKRALQAELGLDAAVDCLLLGLVSRLTDQKGLDLLAAVLPELLDGKTQLVVLGTGDPRYEDIFRRFETDNPGTVCARICYDEALAHRIYAGADALLIPSRFEPCGLTQLIAMRYGTVPIVRETGGLRDTVEAFTDGTRGGNGFCFCDYAPEQLLDAVDRAKLVYFFKRQQWNDIVLRDMGKDVSWDGSARQYRRLYLRLLAPQKN